VILQVPAVGRFLARRQHERFDGHDENHDRDPSAPRSRLGGPSCGRSGGHPGRRLQRHRHPLVGDLCGWSLVREHPRRELANLRTLIVGALVVWIVGEDISIFGGLGTDINSMIPLAVLVYCARPALRRESPLPRRLPEELRSSSGAVVAAFAFAMVAFSVISMGVASVSAAEPTLFIAQNGQAAAVNTKAPVFTLTDQFNRSFTLDEHPGRYTLLTFLDPVCWTDCPLLAAQLQQVRAQLPADAPLDIVVVAANPLHQTLANVRHFIAIHHLKGVEDFYFVTGKTSATRKVWNEYGISVTNEPEIS
jgi:cytochrome oxidase Cu insertion factor (SCO1/SenC/PrrC family)